MCSTSTRAVSIIRGTRTLGRQEQLLKLNARSYCDLHIFTGNMICFLCSFGCLGNKEHCFPSFRPTPSLYRCGVAAASISSGKGTGREGREHSFLQFSSKQTMSVRARVKGNFTIPKMPFTISTVKGSYVIQQQNGWTLNRTKKKGAGGWGTPCCKPWEIVPSIPRNLAKNTSINNKNKTQTYKKPPLFFGEIAILTPEADNSRSGQLGITSILLTNLKEKQSKFELSYLTLWSLNTHSKRKQKFWRELYNKQTDFPHQDN